MVEIIKVLWALDNQPIPPHTVVRLDLKWRCYLKISATAMKAAQWYCDHLTPGFSLGLCVVNTSPSQYTQAIAAEAAFLHPWFASTHSPENRIEHTSHLCQFFLCKGSHKASLISQASPWGLCCCFGAKPYLVAQRDPFELKNRKAFPYRGAQRNCLWPVNLGFTQTFSPWQRNHGYHWLWGEDRTLRVWKAFKTGRLWRIMYKSRGNLWLRQKFDTSWKKY